MKLAVLLLLSCAAGIIAQEVPYQDLIESNNKFTASIYSEVLKDSKGNFLVSPTSLEIVLALSQAGAKDETGKEIRTALHLPEDQEKILSSYKSLVPALKSVDQKYTLNNANKLFVNNGYTINQEFLTTAADVFQAGAENIDFSASKEAAQKINDFVAQETANKIKDLISPLSLGVDTRLVLVNALYFKGEFVKRFKAERTAPGDFHVSSEKTVQADFMHITHFYRYFACPHLKAQFLEIPFKEQGVSLVIVLPNEADGLATLEGENIESVFDTHQNYSGRPVTVSLPKFKIESTLILKPLLQNLGINAAFDEHADFSGIAGKKGDIFISSVVQKSFIDVNEKGVEAAAATAAIYSTRMGLNFRNPEVFTADHPFIYYIKVRGVVIFAGKVTDPTA